LQDIKKYLLQAELKQRLLAVTDGTISNGRNAVIKFTGTITGNQVVTIPDTIEKIYVFENGTSGSFTVQIKTVSGTGPTFALQLTKDKNLYMQMELIL
jgi:hypothetical protein